MKGQRRLPLVIELQKPSVAALHKEEDRQQTADSRPMAVAPPAAPVATWKAMMLTMASAKADLPKAAGGRRRVHGLPGDDPKMRKVTP